VGGGEKGKRGGGGRSLLSLIGEEKKEERRKSLAHHHKEKTRLKEDWEKRGEGGTSTSLFLPEKESTARPSNSWEKKRETAPVLITMRRGGASLRLNRKVGDWLLNDTYPPKKKKDWKHPHEKGKKGCSFVHVYSGLAYVVAQGLFNPCHQTPERREKSGKPALIARRKEREKFYISCPIRRHIGLVPRSVHGERGGEPALTKETRDIVREQQRVRAGRRSPFGFPRRVSGRR